MLQGLVQFGLTRRPIILLCLLVFIGGGLIALTRLNIEAHSSAATTSFVPSDCTLILWPVLRLFAVNHQPVADLLPRSTLKPLSSSRFCVPHMSEASDANSASRLLVESSGFVAVMPARFLSGRMSKALAGAAARTLIAVAIIVNLAVR